MSKLPPQHRFIDLSVYGRPGGRWIAQQLVDTRFTPIHVTLLFVLSGVIAIVCLIEGYYITAAFFLILKSVIDAADGELARLKRTPSHVGRYLDSICDFLLNFLFLSTIMMITQTPWYWALLAFLGIQLQGTLYHYYYVILRNSVNGDVTSRVRENSVPLALPGEGQVAVTTSYYIYTALYGLFDRFVYQLDRNAVNSAPFPSWFMGLLSIYGLGFQLLLMASLLLIGWIELIIPMYIGMTALLLVFVGIRKFILD